MLFMYIIISNIDFGWGSFWASKKKNSVLVLLVWFQCICDVDMYDGKLAEKHYMRRWGELKFYFISIILDCNHSDYHTKM